jgi:hypothetical protein
LPLTKAAQVRKIKEDDAIKPEDVRDKGQTKARYERVRR